MTDEPIDIDEIDGGHIPNESGHIDMDNAFHNFQQVRMLLKAAGLTITEEHTHGIRTEPVARYEFTVEVPLKDKLELIDDD